MTLPNDASVGLHESLGFQPVGVYRDVAFKFGRWYSVGWWQMSLRPRPDGEAPAPSRPASAPARRVSLAPARRPAGCRASGRSSVNVEPSTRTRP